jgi:hypothetical protein
MNKIPVFVPDEELKIYLLLKQSGVFDVRNGSVTINFDKNGVIGNITRNDCMYSNRHV